MSLIDYAERSNIHSHELPDSELLANAPRNSTTSSQDSYFSQQGRIAENGSFANGTYAVSFTI